MNARAMNSKRVRMMPRTRAAIWAGVSVGCWGVRGVLGPAVGVGERDIVSIPVGSITEVVVVSNDGKVVMVVVVVTSVKDAKVVGAGEEGVAELRAGESVGSGFVGSVGFVVSVESVGVREVADSEPVVEEGVGSIGDWSIGTVASGTVVVLEDKGLKTVVVTKTVVAALGAASVVEKTILVSVLVVTPGTKTVVLITTVEVSVASCRFPTAALTPIYSLLGIGGVRGSGLLVGARTRRV